MLSLQCSESLGVGWEVERVVLIDLAQGLAPRVTGPFLHQESGTITVFHHRLGVLPGLGETG